MFNLTHQQRSDLELIIKAAKALEALDKPGKANAGNFSVNPYLNPTGRLSDAVTGNISGIAINSVNGIARSNLSGIAVNSLNLNDSRNQLAEARNCSSDLPHMQAWQGQR